MARSGLFQTLVADFGSVSGNREEEALEREKPALPTVINNEVKSDVAPKSAVRLMLDEERETGEVKWAVYTKYIRAMGSPWWAVIIAATLFLEQGATVGNSFLLGFWSGGSISGFAQGQYMAAYAGESAVDITPCVRKSCESRAEADRSRTGCCSLHREWYFSPAVGCDKQLMHPLISFSHPTRWSSLEYEPHSASSLKHGRVSFAAPHAGTIARP